MFLKKVRPSNLAKGRGREKNRQSFVPLIPIVREIFCHPSVYAPVKGESWMGLGLDPLISHMPVVLDEKPLLNGFFTHTMQVSVEW